MNTSPSIAEQLLQMSSGYIPAMSLHVVASLRVAEQLTSGPKSVEDIAKAVGANPDALYRIMRALSTSGVFQELDGRRFGQSEASDLLRGDHPKSMRSMVVFNADPFHFRCYANLMHSAKTGETTEMPALGKPVFEYLQSDPQELEIFNAAMIGITNMTIPAVLDAYDFSGVEKLVDLGGGYGSVLANILQKYPNMKGVLYDLDHVVRSAGPYLQSMGVSSRCETVGGNFFESAPSGGDAYIMKHIIHDWSDEKSLKILGNIRDALQNQPNGKLLLLELVLPSGPEPHFGKWLDIEMMALPGGRERTEKEFRKLLGQAGFRLARIVPTQSMLSVIEAQPTHPS